MLARSRVRRGGGCGFLLRLMIDLQAHSTVSDGQLEPAEVARAAADAGVFTMSLTDHDAIDGVAEASAAGGQAGVVRPGG